VNTFSQYPGPKLTIHGERRSNARFWSALERFSTAPPTDDPTALCELMRRHGSDKGQRWHNYTPLYHALLQRDRKRVSCVFELGIGTLDTSIPSNMAPLGVPGASIRAWRDYFPNAEIYAADIDRSILFDDQRIKTAWVDQRDPASVRAMWNAFGLTGIDLIVDDGLHDAEANEIFLRESYDQLKVGGIYIIEDLRISKESIQSYELFISGYAGDYAIISRPHDRNDYDNCVAIIEKVIQP